MKLLTRRFAWMSLCFLSVAYAPAHAQNTRLQGIEVTAAAGVPVAAKEKPLRLSLADLMKAYNVPGLSIAIIEKYKIVEAKGYGAIEIGSNTSVTTHVRIFPANQSAVARLAEGASRYAATHFSVAPPPPSGVFGSAVAMIFSTSSG
jgi:CubicO group peptidase (beta-lactamase class C family)